jgi:hypothetical protein
MTDKTSVSVFWGQRTGLNARHEDALPLRVGAAVLGRGFTSRLLSKVRDEEGLTYDIRGGLASDTFSDGEFRITASFAPEMLEQGLASTRRELEAWHRNGITAEELSRVKSDLIGSYKVGLATTDGMAGAILETLHRGYDLSWLDRYSEAVSALSLDRVNQVISSYLDPAQLVLVKAGSIPSPTSAGNKFRKPAIKNRPDDGSRPGGVIILVRRHQRHVMPGATPCREPAGEPPWKGVTPLRSTHDVLNQRRSPDFHLQAARPADPRGFQPRKRRRTAFRRNYRDSRRRHIESCSCSWSDGDLMRHAHKAS